MALANAIGCAVFAPLSGRSAKVLVPLEFAGTAIGLGIVFAAVSVPVATVGAVITGFSTGMLLPTLLVWAVNRLTFSQRGRGNGWWLFSLFLGEFSSALVITGLAAVAGGLRPGLAVLAVLTVVVAGIVLLVQRRETEPLATPETTEPLANPASSSSEGTQGAAAERTRRGRHPRGQRNRPGLVDRFAAEGMKVVIADVEKDPLDQAVSEVVSTGAEAIGVVTDVSDREAVENLAASTMDAFGAAHVLCNNAGVETGGRSRTFRCRAGVA
jgi:MFS family permease